MRVESGVHAGEVDTRFTLGAVVRRVRARRGLVAAKRAGDTVERRGESVGTIHIFELLPLAILGRVCRYW